MGEEEKKDEQAKPAEPVLECGHVDSFEHRLMCGLLTLIGTAQALGMDPLDAGMAAIKRVCDYYYIQLPNAEEMARIEISKSQESKEVH